MGLAARLAAVERKSVAPGNDVINAFQSTVQPPVQSWINQANSVEDYRRRCDKAADANMAIRRIVIRISTEGLTLEDALAVARADQHLCKYL